MPTYTFVCRTCWQRKPVEASINDTVPEQRCRTCGVVMARDYKHDGVQASIGDLKREREAGSIRDLVLPTADDYKSPADPEGTAGLRQWREDHEPVSGNTRPAEVGGRELKKAW